LLGAGTQEEAVEEEVEEQEEGAVEEAITVVLAVEVLYLPQVLLPYTSPQLEKRHIAERKEFSVKQGGWASILTVTCFPRRKPLGTQRSQLAREINLNWPLLLMRRKTTSSLKP
jgi:hypothetical protein